MAPPHPSARGTLTLLNSVLLSTHYGRSDSCPPSSSAFFRHERWLLREQVSLIHAPGLPAIPSPNTCGCSASSGQGTLPYQRVGPSKLPFGNSGLRLGYAGSPHHTGRIEFRFLSSGRDLLRTSRSPPAALHLVSPRRSCIQLQVTLTWIGLLPLRPGALSGARSGGFAPQRNGA
jgi:hypothetical protein